ncbi:DNA cytosine methyltransferase [uncultured Psychrobacter sp.]|uniref:DNA cytosine methyltransferase n=1 Tax=uncultured Psychrobacter sp. TaxID=259303 RepID=UPI002620A2D5|nr:DNA cytosine methyltransferase [uncultured Psychrobacter sp.]
MKKMNFIDLFAGAGGLSEGFVKAGFEPIAHVEMDTHACKTLETRNYYYSLKKANKLQVYYDYLLGNISHEDLSESVLSRLDNVINASIGDDNTSIFNRIDELTKGREVDLIIGGPPCQAYSVVGRHRINKLEADDPRNLLYRQYARFLKKYNPKVFVFENVLGILSAEEGRYFNNIKVYFRTLGYELESRVLNTSDYGVLQNRKRVIIIGWKKGSDFSYPELIAESNPYTVADILEDLAYLKPGDQNNITNYASDTNEYLEKSAIRNGADFVTQHVARTHNDRDLEIYKIAIDKWLNGKERLKYGDLPERLKTHKNQNSFVDRFKVVDINSYSHTVLAHIAKDGHYYIYPSTEQVRSLSVREAARIQSFPDDYYFEGGRSAAFKQIGNAVPPLMALKIAEEIKRVL